MAIPSWVGAIITSQRAVASCGWGVKAGMVRVWVAGKTVTHVLYLSALEIKSLYIKCYKIHLFSVGLCLALVFYRIFVCTFYWLL